MRNLLLIASAAAMALAAPAVAEKGGKGGGGPGGGGHGGGQQAGKGGGGHEAGEREQHGGVSFKRDKDRGRLSEHARGSRSGGKGRERHGSPAAKPERVASHAPAALRGGRMRDDHSAPQQGFRREDIGAPRDLQGAARPPGMFLAGSEGGCPRGLAKRNNGCLPPGQARKAYRLGDRVDSGWFAQYDVPSSYRSFYADTPDYRYRYDDDGYIYRVDTQTNVISGLVPLLGGGFAVGQPMPAGYDVYNLPSQYRDNWYDSDEAHYRYGDNAIYQVDPQSGLIEGIVSLFTGDLNVGQALPGGYDVYNLPLEYRDEFTHSDEDLHRYADGNIYRVDAKTRMIQAIVEMLV